MKGRLVNLVAPVSVVLCVALAVLWGRSQRQSDSVSCGLYRIHYGADSELCILSEGGAICLYYYSSDLNATVREPVRLGFGYNLNDPYHKVHDPYSGLARRAAVYGVQLWGFAFANQSHTHAGDGSRSREITVIMPHWFMVAVFAAVSLRWALVKYRALPYRNKNLCPCCGYDMRATPDCCPECGAMAAGRPKGGGDKGK